MLFRLLYIAVFIVASVLAYKSWVMHSTISMVQSAPLGNYIGPEDAKLIVVEFIDYRCSYCREAHPEMERFLANHDDIKVVFRHLPNLGKGSLHDAQLALAAGMQGKFKEVHDDLITRETSVDDNYIMKTAMDLELDYDKLMIDLKGPEIGGFLLDNIDAIERLSINATPSFLFGDILFVPSAGSPTAEDFEKLAQEAMK